MMAPTQDIKALIQRCAQGEVAARIAFQEEYGPLVYSFPVRVFHLSEADAGEFYLYAFERDRIFQRIRTFEGRNTIQFTTYLSFYVLRDLLLEWLRMRGSYPEMLSLGAPIGPDATESDAPRTLGQRLAGETATPEEVLLDAEDWQRVLQALEALEPEKRLLLKLLSLAKVDLEPNEIRFMAQLSGRGIGETIQVLEEIREALQRFPVACATDLAKGNYPIQVSGTLS